MHEIVNFYKIYDRLAIKNVHTVDLSADIRQADVMMMMSEEKHCRSFIFNLFHEFMVNISIIAISLLDNNI